MNQFPEASQFPLSSLQSDSVNANLRPLRARRGLMVHALCKPVFPHLVCLVICYLCMTPTREVVVMQDQGMAGAAETDLADLRQQQADSAADFDDLLAALGQETAKVRPALWHLEVLTNH